MKTHDQFWFDLFDRQLSRRDLLRVARDASGLIALGTLTGAGRIAASFRSNPFTLGVASGDPWPDGVVLWTRLDAAALREAGLHASTVPVAWEIAADDNFRNVVRRGSASALPQLGHSVHAEITNLQPGRPYWYRFHLAEVTSPVGRTRTAPARNEQTQGLRFAVASCQKYQDGYFTAYRHLTEEDFDLLVFLGDYIYEDTFNDSNLRRGPGGEIFTLDDYRQRYSIYRSDADLQAAHAALPWILTFDDHEVSNNYAGSLPQREQDAATFGFRRTAAYQAFYEFMPLRRTSLPRGPDILIYRRLEWGRLARFHVLDTRQYRTNQPCGDGQKARCAEATSPSATMMGSPQENWLQEGLRNSPARWNAIANQVMIAQLARTEPTGRTFPMDKWDGYTAARQRLLDVLVRARSVNPVVLTGDIHSNWIADLKTDFDDPASPIVAAEFVGTSISSGGDGRDTTARTAATLAENPHLKFYNGQRGYLRCVVTEKSWTTDVRVVPFVTRPAAPISTRASFVVQAGVPGVQPG